MAKRIFDVEHSSGMTKRSKLKHTLVETSHPDFDEAVDEASFHPSVKGQYIHTVKEHELPHWKKD